MPAPGILGHSLTNSFSAPRPQAAGIWQPRRVALFFVVGLLGFSAASLSLSQSLALCWAVCLPHPACQTAVPTRCHWWGPPNWHAWLKRLGAIITQITAGRGKHSLSVLVPMVEQKPLPSSLLAPSRQAFDESVRLCGVCETRDYTTNEQHQRAGGGHFHHHLISTTCPS